MKLNNAFLVILLTVGLFACSGSKKTHRAYEKIYSDNSDSIMVTIDTKTSYIFGRIYRFKKQFHDSTGKYKMNEVITHTIFNNSKHKYRKKTYQINNGKSELKYCYKRVTIVHFRDKKMVEKKHDIEGYKNYCLKQKYYFNVFQFSDYFKEKECSTDTLGVKTKKIKKFKPYAQF